MENKSIGEKILQDIKDRQIAPKPKWEFAAKNYFFWLIFGAIILIGSLASSAMLFMIFNTDWEYQTAEGGILEQLMLCLPIFWLVLLAVFVLIAIYDLKKTKKGYRYNLITLISVSVLSSLILGSFVYAIGGGEKLENYFYQKIPFYKKIDNHKGMLLIRPEGGRMAGTVIKINDENIIIQDFTGRVWIVPTSTLEFKPGQRIHFFGKKINEEQFDVKIFKSWFRSAPPPPHPCLNPQQKKCN